MKYARSMRLLFIGMILLLTGCSENKPLRVASHVWPGYEFMHLAEREGWIDPERDAIEFVHSTSASESMRAMQTGSVDAAALTLDEALRLQRAGVPIAVVLIFNISVGSDVLLARPQIRNLGQLAGKRIGAEQGALGALMLAAILEKARLRPEDLHIVPVAIDEHLDAWQTHSLDALITFEPTATFIQQQTNARHLFDSSMIPHLIFDVLAVHRDALERMPAALRTLIAGHFRALRHFRTNPADASYRMAERLGISGTQVPDIFAGLELPTAPYNREFLSCTDDEHCLKRTAEHIGEILMRAGILESPPDTSQLFTPQFLPTGEH